MAVHELHRLQGENSSFVTVSLKDDIFRVDTQDLGPLVELVWGDSDYEYWTIVPKEAWGDLLMAFTREFLNGDPEATDKLRDICEKYEVKYERGSWA